ALREQPLPVPAAGGAGSVRAPGVHAGGTHRWRAVPQHRGPVVPADAAGARLLLVPADEPGRRRRSEVSPLSDPRELVDDLAGDLKGWLPEQRWFAGKDRPVTGARPPGVTELVSAIRSCCTSSSRSSRRTGVSPT